VNSALPTDLCSNSVLDGMATPNSVDCGIERDF
jgi:hypothetical protein